MIPMPVLYNDDWELFRTGLSIRVLCALTSYFEPDDNVCEARVMHPCMCVFRSTKLTIFFCAYIHMNRWNSNT